MSEELGSLYVKVRSDFSEFDKELDAKMGDVGSGKSAKLPVDVAGKVSGGGSIEGGSSELSLKEVFGLFGQDGLYNKWSNKMKTLEKIGGTLGIGGGGSTAMTGAAATGAAGAGTGAAGTAAAGTGAVAAGGTTAAAGGAAATGIGLPVAALIAAVAAVVVVLVAIAAVLAAIFGAVLIGVKTAMANSRILADAKSSIGEALGMGFDMLIIWLIGLLHPFLGPIFEWISQSIGPALNFLREKLVPAAEGTFASLADTLGPMWASYWGYIQSIGGPAWEAIQNVMENILGPGMTIAKDMLSLISPAIDLMLAFWEPIMKPIMEGIRDATEAAKPVLDSVATFLGDHIFPFFRDTLFPILEPIAGILGTVIGVLLDWVFFALAGIIYPILKVGMDVLDLVLGPFIDLFSLVLRATLIPAFEAIEYAVNWIAKYLDPQFVEETVQSAGKWLDENVLENTPRGSMEDRKDWWERYLGFKNPGNTVPAGGGDTGSGWFAGKYISDQFDGLVGGEW